MVEPRSKNDVKKKIEKGEGKGAVAPFLSAVSSRFFFSCLRLLNFADPTISKPNRRKRIYIRIQTKTDTSGWGFYFNWGTKRRIKMTEVQLEKIDYVTGGLPRVEITF